ncbi:MAG: hypothetical protein PHI36_01715 [Bacteroidales bacterium]|nr:hypothetical protein [Bacteroidales bacterium]
MKNVNLNVEFKDPIKELKEQLQRSGARNIDVRRSYNGEVEVRYTMKCADPEKEIESMLKQSGAENIRSSSSYNGARYDMRIDDRLDERKFKQDIIDSLRRNGIRSN